MADETKLQFRVCLQPTHVELDFIGRMDADEIRRVEEDVDLATNGSLPTIVDLCALTFMESLGIALIVRMAKKAMAKKVPFIVAVGTGPVAKLFGIARLDKVLTIAFSREAARQVMGLPGD
jgi:anti-anti-sigma factor